MKKLLAGGPSLVLALVMSIARSLAPFICGDNR